MMMCGIEFAIARLLRTRGWIGEYYLFHHLVANRDEWSNPVPAYTMAPHAEKLKLLRVVVREDFSLNRARSFLRGGYRPDFRWFFFLSLMISFRLDLLDAIKMLDN